MQPDLDTVTAEFTDVDLVFLNAAADPQVVAELRVFATPTLIAVRDGAEIARFTGRRTRSELRELFAQLGAGDPITLRRVGHGDRIVWTTAGVALAGVGLLLGPSWLLVIAGAALTTVANRGWGNRK